MPIPLPPVHDNGIMDHLETIIKLVTPLIASIVYLIVWAWKKMEKAQDKLETALNMHVREDETIHDKLFTESRRMDKEITEVKTRQTDCEKCP